MSGGGGGGAGEAEAGDGGLVEGTRDSGVAGVVLGEEVARAELVEVDRIERGEVGLLTKKTN